jgi:hypothetical protein
MPRYFFHTEDGTSHLDEDGLELPNHRAAQIEALKTLGQLLNDESSEVLDGHGLKLIVTDNSGLILFVLDLSAVTAPAIRQPLRQA